MVRFIILIFLLIYALSPLAQAPPCNLVLSGRVLEAGNDETLPFAQISCVELERGVIADSTGHYVFAGICPGEYTFVCRHVGCEPLTVRLEVRFNLMHDFVHEHIPRQMDVVSIVSERPGYKAIQGTQRLTEKDLQKLQGKSLADALGTLNGVSILRNGATIGKPIIRGLHSNRILIMNNGVRQEGQQWGNEHAPEIDPFVATRMVLIKGASAVRFGSDAIAGVVLVEPPAMRMAPGMGGRIQLAGISNGRSGAGSAILEGRLKKFPAWSWRVQGTLKRGGNIHTPDYYLSNTGLSEFNYSGAVEYHLGRIRAEVYYSRFQSEIGIFSGAHIGNLTDLQRALEARVPATTSGFSYVIGRPYQQVDHELLKAAATIQLNEHARLRLIYARQYNNRREFDKHVPLNDSLAALNRPALQFELTTHSMEVVLEKRHTSSWNGMFGAQAIAQGNTYEGRFFIPNFKKYNAGIFAIERYRKPESAWEWESGLRFDAAEQQVFMRAGQEIVAPEHRYHNLAANVGMVYYRSEDETYRINVATAWRPPSINEMYSSGLHHGVAAIETGDPNLRAERSAGIELFGEKRYKGISIEVQPYMQFIDHFIYLRPAAAPLLTIRGAFPAFQFEQTDALLIGHDTRISFEASEHIRATLRTSLLRAWDIETGKHIVQMPSDAYGISVELHARQWKKLHQLFVTASTDYRNKQWRVPATEDFAGSPDAYVIASLQCGFQIPIHNQLVVMSFSCDNLFNTVYRDYLNRFRYYSDEMGRSFSLRVTLPFDLLSTKHHNQENNSH